MFTLYTHTLYYILYNNSIIKKFQIEYFFYLFLFIYIHFIKELKKFHNFYFILFHNFLIKKGL